MPPFDSYKIKEASYQLETSLNAFLMKRQILLYLRSLSTWHGIIMVEDGKQNFS